MGSPVATGAQLGRYEVVKHLASGTMAELLLARARGLEGFERHFVIKRIREDRESDQGFVDMFLSEARLAAALHHHNIVQVHDIGEDDGKPYFAMEYVHGEDLRRVLGALHAKQTKMPLEHVIAIVCAVAAALNHAHEAQGPDRTNLGIVHRDVTPANILVSYDGGVKVVDFGIARAAMRRTETQAGMLAGKAPYMAPEQCTGGVIDRRSDVFSLGIVLFELITGRRLFKGENEFMTMSSVVEANVPPPSRHRQGVPEALDGIVLKALARDPKERYQTAEHMFLALDKVATHEGLRSSGLSLAGYMKDLLGYRPEPWLTSEGPRASPVDYDGFLPGLAPPPSQHSDTYPTSPNTTRASPILQARTNANSDSPVVARTTTPIAEQKSAVRIPDALAKPRTKTGAVPILGPTPMRGRPMTVQIPVTRAPSEAEAPVDSPRASSPVVARTATLPVSPVIRPPALAMDAVDDGWGSSAVAVPRPPLLPPPAPMGLDAPTERLPGKPQTPPAGSLRRATPIPGVKPIPRVAPAAKLPTFDDAKLAEGTSPPPRKLAESTSEIPTKFPRASSSGFGDESETEVVQPSDSDATHAGVAPTPDEPLVIVRASSLGEVPEEEVTRSQYLEHTSIDELPSDDNAAMFAADPMLSDVMPPMAERPFASSPRNAFGPSAFDVAPPYPVYQQQQPQHLASAYPTYAAPVEPDHQIVAARPSQGQETWLVRTPETSRAPLSLRTKIIGGSVAALVLLVVIAIATNKPPPPAQIASVPEPRPEVATPTVRTDPPPPPPEPAVVVAAPTPAPTPVVTKPVIKAAPKKVAKIAVTKPRPVAKPTTKPTTKIAAKPVAKKVPATPTKKRIGWDPNALFPKKK